MKAGEETGSIGSYEFVPLGTGGTVGKSLTGLKLIILMERIKDSSSIAEATRGTRLVEGRNPRLQVRGTTNAGARWLSRY